MLKKSLFWGMTAILAVSFGLMGCEEKSDPLKSGEKSIIAFSVNGVEGVIDEDKKLITVTLPANSPVTALAPIVVVSKAAQLINPADGTVIGEPGAGINDRQLTAQDFTVGRNYVVKAEDGTTQTYRVEVTVLPAEAVQSVEVTIALPNSAAEPVVYGIPEGGIVLSRFGRTENTPDRILISVGGVGQYSTWSDVTWYIDGSHYSTDNIITIWASGSYTLEQPHTITFVGTKGGVEYSKTITFTVKK